MCDRVHLPRFVRTSASASPTWPYRRSARVRANSANFRQSISGFTQFRLRVAFRQWRGIKPRKVCLNASPRDVIWLKIGDISCQQETALAGLGNTNASRTVLGSRKAFKIASCLK